jgi:hypothetical protein
MPNQQSTTDKKMNPNTMPDKKQVRPENADQVEKEGQQFDTQNKNPETYKNEPKVNDPKTPGTPGRMETAPDTEEGTDEPNPYHELQAGERGVGEDKPEGDRDNLH